MPFMFCGASLIFSLYNSCKTNNARTSHNYVDPSPLPSQKKNKLKKKKCYIDKKPRRNFKSNCTADFDIYKQLSWHLHYYSAYKIIPALCSFCPFTLATVLPRLKSAQRKTGGEYFPINGMAPKLVCPQKTKEYKC